MSAGPADAHGQAGATVVRALAPRWWPLAFAAQVAVVAATTAAALWLAPTFWPLVALTAVQAWTTWRTTHARVGVDDAGLTVRRLTTRRTPWDRVRALALDPPGGPRHLRAEVARGELVELPLLGEDDTETVLRAWRAARG